MLNEMCSTASLHTHWSLYTTSSKVEMTTLQTRDNKYYGVIGHMMQTGGISVRSFYLPNYIT